MEDFRRQFLSEAVEKLENLQRKLANPQTVSDSLKAEVFRALHTIKGTAQTFGFDIASRLAHQLETLLSDAMNSRNTLIVGIKLLQKSLTDNNFQIPERFAKKLSGGFPNVELESNDSNGNSAVIPDEIYSQLSNRERKTTSAAVRGGKSLAVFEVFFDAANFAAELIKFREILNSTGEIIATFPSAKSNQNGKIGFRFLAASSEVFQDSANVVWNFSPAETANDIKEIFRQIVRHGAEIAVKLDKKIEIETQIDQTSLSSAELKIVFELLLHLVRNAVDHAIESVGKIEISIKQWADGFRLAVADDGRGIDSERVKARAIENKIIAAAENLSETEAIMLIFQPNFSTKSGADEISGRGIGLDAVKHTVEKFGGEISLVTEKEKGTTFEIFLPRTI